MSFITRILLATGIYPLVGAHVYTSICEAACATLRDTEKKCAATGAHTDGTCRHLFKNAKGGIYYDSHFDIPGVEKVAVDEAFDLIKAPNNDCLAMCYANKLCREKGTKCNDNGVCHKLYWNFGSSNDKQYTYIAGKVVDTNERAPVLCDPESVEPEPEPQTFTGFTDSCKSLCALEHHQDECHLVYQVKDSCHRLYWSTSEKKGTKLVYGKDVEGLTQVLTREAFAVVKATSNDCKTACLYIPACASSQRQSYCRVENHTCRDLFYNAGDDLSNKAPCYGTECNENSPMTCILPGESVEWFDPKAKSQKDGAPTVVVATTNHTTTKSERVLRAYAASTVVLAFTVMSLV